MTSSDRCPSSSAGALQRRLSNSGHTVARRGSDTSAASSAAGVRSSEFYRRLSLGILSNSSAADDSASYFRHPTFAAEKRSISSLGERCTAA